MEFLPDMATMATFTLASLLLCLTPGPDMTLFVGTTLAQGRRAGMAALLGTASGCLIHTMLAVLGVSVLLAASPTAFWMLKIAGATYLLWLAIQAFRQGSTLIVENGAAKVRGFATNYLKGIGINILNPKVVIFFITFLPLFVESNDPAAWQKMLFLGVFFVVFTTPIMALLVLAAERLAVTLKQKPAVGRAIDWLFGTVFAIFAVRILFTEAR